MKNKKKKIEDLINEMDWDPNKIDSKKEENFNMPDPKAIHLHYNKLEKEVKEIYKNPTFKEHEEEIYKLAISSIQDLCDYVAIKKIQADKRLTFEEQRSLIRKIAPSRKEYEIIGLNGSTMLHKVVLPQLIKFWTDASEIVGSPEQFENVTDSQMDQILQNIEDYINLDDIEGSDDNE